MTTAVLILGCSGTGKSTSIRTLDPSETFIINVIGKPLPFKHSSKKYTPLSADGMSGNYYATDDSASILRVINLVNNKRMDIKNLIVDDWGYSISSEYMRKALDKGYEKFSILGQNAWSTLNAVIRVRSDLFTFVMCHSEMDMNGMAKVKTIGKLLDEKVCIEGLFSICLHSLVVEEEYKFLTQHHPQYLAKSPMGMFDKKLINNDLAYVKSKMVSYFEEEFTDVQI